MHDATQEFTTTKENKKWGMYNYFESSFDREKFSADFCNENLFSTGKRLSTGLMFADQTRLEEEFGRKFLTYDGYIVKKSLIPVRRGNLHDYFNFLVWMNLPFSKHSLHKRQWHYQLERSLVNQKNRGRSEDKLTLFDEGGALVAVNENGETLALLFGHALWESMYLGKYDVSACAYHLPMSSLSFVDNLAAFDTWYSEQIEKGWLESTPAFGLKLLDAS